MAAGAPNPVRVIGYATIGRLPNRGFFLPHNLVAGNNELPWPSQSMEFATFTR